MKLAALLFAAGLMALGPSFQSDSGRLVKTDTVPPAADTTKKDSIQFYKPTTRVISYEFTQQQLAWTYQAFEYAKNMPLMRHDIPADSAAQQMYFYIRFMQTAINVLNGWRAQEKKKLKVNQKVR